MKPLRTGCPLHHGERANDNQFKEREHVNHVHLESVTLSIAKHDESQDKCGGARGHRS